MPRINRHPVEIKADSEADRFVFQNVFYPKSKADAFVWWKKPMKELARLMRSIANLKGGNDIPKCQ